MSTFMATAKLVSEQDHWHVIDANDQVLGRVATEAARLLQGKHKPSWTPFLDHGDHVVVINAAKVRLTGNKMEDKIFHYHTGFPGGVKERTPRQTLEGKSPHKLLVRAVERMMKKDSPLARRQMTNLKVYAGAEHPHAAQSPSVLDVAKMNPKNKRSA